MPHQRKTGLNFRQDQTTLVCEHEGRLSRLFTPLGRRTLAELLMGDPFYARTASGAR
jgi:hypothetical protein